MKDNGVMGMLIGTIVVVALIVFSLNLPMGYWRVTCRKLSPSWFLAIHLPIPFVFLLRVLSGLTWHYIPVLFVFSIIGQVVGGRSNKNHAGN